MGPGRPGSPMPQSRHSTRVRLSGPRRLGHRWFLSQGPNSWGPGLGPSTPQGPLARPGHFSPLDGSPGLAETRLQAQLLPGSRSVPRARPSRSCPSTLALHRGLGGALFTPRACHGARALPAGTGRGSRPRGGAVSGPRTHRTGPGSGLSGPGVLALRAGVSPSPDLPRPVPGADLPGDPSQGPARPPARPGPAQSPVPALPVTRAARGPSSMPIPRGPRSATVPGPAFAGGPAVGPPGRRVLGSGLRGPEGRAGVRSLPGPDTAEAAA